MGLMCCKNSTTSFAWTGQGFASTGCWACTAGHGVHGARIYVCSCLSVRLKRHQTALMAPSRIQLLLGEGQAIQAFIEAKLRELQKPVLAVSRSAAQLDCERQHLELLRWAGTLDSAAAHHLALQHAPCSSMHHVALQQHCSCTACRREPLGEVCTALHMLSEAMGTVSRHVPRIAITFLSWRPWSGVWLTSF